jgi:hypothetical protein
MTARRLRAALGVAATAVGAGMLAALVFLIRAGGAPDDPATWPIQWELRSSDNGVLFQFWQDVAAGRELDWSFSPQVYVVPELPLSGIAFLVTGGDVYLSYLVVAALHAAGMLLALFALVRVRFRTGDVRVALARTSVAAVPLLLLPLVGTTWLFSFPLAPSYYAGEYAAILLAPVLVLARTRAARIGTAVVLALTIASNPLTLLFVGAGGVAALLAVGARSGMRALVRPGARVLGVLAAAAVARLAMSPLQGTSPLAYVDLDRFRGRLDALGPYLSYQARDPAAALVLVVGAVLAGVCAAAAVAALVAVLRLGSRADPRLPLVVYLGAVPVGGLVATFLALITHQYYLWPVLILPFTLVLLAVPRVALPHALLTGAAALVIVGLVTGAATNLPRVDRYLGYRTAETRCLDRVVPGEVGYATFSDARRLGLPSATGLRLIAIRPSGEPNTWLANRATSRTEVGTFFYVNGRGDELALDRELLRERFGAPTAVVACDDDREIWRYDDAGALDRIAAYYGVG